MGWECDDYFDCSCGRSFPAGWRAREQHCDATGHDRPEWECDSCSSYFDDEDDMNNHMIQYDHWHDDRIECDFCYNRFWDDGDLREHEVDIHFYCVDCDKTCMNRNNIRMHLNSNVHRVGNNTSTAAQCPFCKSHHNRATGLVYHLENGCCPNAPLDRTKLYLAVRAKDPHGLISKKLLEYRDGPVATEYQATARSWNPTTGAYECYLCHRQFNALTSLNQHLASPVHQQSLYHCIKGTCGREFTTLAGLVQHLESESCGAMRFEQVQTGMQNLVDPGRRLAFR